MTNRVLHSFAYCLDYLREQVADVASDQMCAQAGGIVNHPAWVIGHLTYSCQALGGEIGLDEWLPATWADAFGTGSVPVPDVGAYLSKDELLEHLRDAESRIASAVRALDESELTKPLPDEKYREIMPTVGHAITQVLVAHPANHIGQLTLWRRAKGFPKLDRLFA